MDVDVRPGAQPVPSPHLAQRKTLAAGLVLSAAGRELRLRFCVAGGPSAAGQRCEQDSL
jgi:hypothetical protein